MRRPSSCFLSLARDRLKTMKKIIIILLFLFFLFFPKPEVVLGNGACCKDQYYFNSATGRCCKRTPGNCTDVNCASGETCYYTTSGFGTCLANVPPERYSCTAGTCVSDPTSGVYTTLSDCQNVCGGGSGSSGAGCNPPCNDDEEICTAIGCINVKTPGSFVGSILTLALGLAGGIAFLLIIFGSIQVLLSSGNPDKIQAGKELITSAITGLLLIIFAVFILRIIGVEILQIPDFG